MHSPFFARKSRYRPRRRLPLDYRLGVRSSARRRGFHQRKRERDYFELDESIFYMLPGDE